MTGRPAVAVIRLADLSDGALDRLVEELQSPAPRLDDQGFSPIAHGTFPGSRQHYWRRVPMCEPCRQAERDHQARCRAAARLSGKDTT